MSATWDPSIYLKFGGERTRAAADLLARVPLDDPKHIVDLGCGPGNSTALIAARYSNADILGVDASEDMLQKARASGVRARFQYADINLWAPDDRYDLIYSNAMLHWLRDPLLTAQSCFRALAPGGVLAIQVPQNFDRPSHVNIAEAVQAGPWRTALANVFKPSLLYAEDYARALAPLGAELDIWTTDYLHILDGPDPVLRWISGSALRPYLDQLDASQRAAFEAEVGARLRAAYPPESDGRTFFPFRRLFVIAKAGVSS